MKNYPTRVQLDSLERAQEWQGWGGPSTPPLYNGSKGHTHECSVDGCPNSMRYECPVPDNACPMGVRDCYQHWFSLKGEKHACKP